MAKTEATIAEVPRKSFAVIDDEVAEQSLDAMSGLHPAGIFQVTLSQIFRYLGEYKDQKTKQLAQDMFYIFAFTTVDKAGVRRVMLSKQMTGKPHSSNSTMGKLLKPWFNNAKPEEMKTLVPTLGSLADRNGLMKIDHEPNALNTGIFATIASLQPIQEGPDGKPVYPQIYTDETYVDIVTRFPDDYERIEDPTAPVGSGKMIWFRRYKERDDAPANGGKDAPSSNGGGNRPRPNASPSY